MQIEFYTTTGKKSHVNVHAGEFCSYETSRKAAASNFFSFIFDEL